MPGDRQHVLLREVVLAENALREVWTVAQRQVSRGDAPVGLGKAHLGIVEKDVEKRPFGVGQAEVIKPRRLQAAAKSVPTRQAASHPRPCQPPRDGAERVKRPPAPSPPRPRCIAHPTQFFNPTNTSEPP